jgi:hypothetical protein
LKQRTAVFPRNRPSLNSPMGRKARPERAKAVIFGPERGGSPGQDAAAGHSQSSSRDSSGIGVSGLLKWLNSLYRPALPEGIRGPTRPTAFQTALGRSQAVRQWILIPPFGGSIPPAPARPCSVQPGAMGVSLADISQRVRRASPRCIPPPYAAEPCGAANTRCLLTIASVPDNQLANVASISMGGRRSSGRECFFAFGTTTHLPLVEVKISAPYGTGQYL